MGFDLRRAFAERVRSFEIVPDHDGNAGKSLAFKGCLQSGIERLWDDALALDGVWLSGLERLERPSRERVDGAHAMPCTLALARHAQGAAGLRERDVGAAVALGECV